MRLVVAVLAAAFACSPALSHSWYDPLCCHERDCEPLPDGSVTMTPTGYHVKYTGKMGFSVDVIVPFEKAKPSRDDKFHGCATAERFLCLYVPMNV